MRLVDPLNFVSGRTLILDLFARVARRDGDWAAMKDEDGGGVKASHTWYVLKVIKMSGWIGSMAGSVPRSQPMCDAKIQVTAKVR